MATRQSSPHHRTYGPVSRRVMPGLVATRNLATGAIVIRSSIRYAASRVGNLVELRAEDGSRPVTATFHIRALGRVRRVVRLAAIGRGIRTNHRLHGRSAAAARLIGGAALLVRQYGGERVVIPVGHQFNFHAISAALADVN